MPEQIRNLYIEPESRWENSCCESFNPKLRDEFLNEDIVCSMKEPDVPAERWRGHYNTLRLHPWLDYRRPAPAAWQPETATAR